MITDAAVLAAADGAARIDRDYDKLRDRCIITVSD